MVRFAEYLKYVSAKSGNQENGGEASLSVKNFEDQPQQKNKPKFKLEIRGKRSLLDADASLRVPLTFNCIQFLILQALNVTDIKPSQPSWFHLFNSKFISNVTVVIIDGWDLSDLTSIISDQEEPPEKKRKVSEETSPNVTGESNLYQSAEEGPSILERVQESLPYSSECFPLKLQVTPPTEEPVVELFSSVSMSVDIVKSIVKKYNSLRRAAKFNIVFPIARNEEQPPKIKEKFTPMVKNHKDKFSRVDLLLSVVEMAKLNYPLGLKGTLSGEDPQYVTLHSHYENVTAKSPMYGIDCEMCKTTEGIQLTQVSVVDENLNVIYTSFVKPGNHVVNFLTGNAPDHLKDITTSVVQVQEKLRQILPKDCILVGHSIDRDLNALKLLHPYIIDTSCIYKLSYNVYRRPKLSLLAKLFLNQEIQSGDIKGHDPSEDAAASLELALLKLRNNISYGDVRKGGEFPCSKTGFIRMVKEKKFAKASSFYSSKNIFGETYGSTVPKIIKLESDNKSIVFTNCEETLGDFESYGMDSGQLTHGFGEALEKELEAHTQFKFIVRHCQVPDILSSGKSRKKLRKKLGLIDEKLKTLHETMPENSLILTVFTKRKCSATQEDFLLLDFKKCEYIKF